MRSSALERVRSDVPSARSGSETPDRTNVSAGWKFPPVEPRESAQAVEAMTTVAVKLRPICGRTPSRVAASSYSERRAGRGPFHCISARPAFSKVAAGGNVAPAPPPWLASALTSARFITADTSAYASAQAS